MPTKNVSGLFWVGFLALGCCCRAGDAGGPPTAVPRGASAAPNLDPALQSQASAVISARYEGALDPGDPHGQSPLHFRVTESLKGAVKAGDFVTPADVPAYRGYTPALRVGRSYVLYLTTASSILALHYLTESAEEAAERRAAEGRWERLERCRFSVDDWRRSRAIGGPTPADMTCAVRWLHDFLLQHENRLAIVEALGEPDHTQDATESYSLNSAGTLHPLAGALIGELEISYASGCQIHHKLSFEVYENTGFRPATTAEQRSWSLPSGTTVLCTDCEGRPHRCDSQ